MGLEILAESGFQEREQLFEFGRLRLCQVAVQVEFDARGDGDALPGSNGARRGGGSSLTGDDLDPIKEQPLELGGAAARHQCGDSFRRHPLPQQLAQQQGLDVVAKAIDHLLASALRGVDAAERLVVAEGPRRELLAGPRVHANLVGSEPGGHVVDPGEQLDQRNALRPVHAFDLLELADG